MGLLCEMVLGDTLECLFFWVKGMWIESKELLSGKTYEDAHGGENM